MTATVRTDDVHILIEPEIDIDLSWLDDDDDNEYTVLMATVWHGDDLTDFLGNITLQGDQDWMIAGWDLFDLQRYAKDNDAAVFMLEALGLPIK